MTFLRILPLALLAACAARVATCGELKCRQEFTGIIHNTSSALPVLV